ncbi:MAG: transcription elongation factor GreA [Ignavibacteriales bacterium]|nr:transcription elongation factor GreA [Ignavibacteriales bacterium]
MSDVVYLTKEKFVELEHELREMMIHGRAQVAQKIAEARGHGDLSENAEYDAAREEQRHLEYRISKLEETLSKSRIIDSKDLPTDKVYILSKVTVKDSKNGKKIQYQLVSPEEADFDLNKISSTSPIGKGLLGKKVGEIVEIKVPAGLFTYEIIEISR